MKIFSKKHNAMMDLEFVVYKLPEGSKKRYRAHIVESWSDGTQKCDVHVVGDFDAKSDGNAAILKYAANLV